MKTLSWKLFGLLFVMFVAISTFAQTDATATSQTGDQNPLAKNPSETTRVVTERGAHYRVWADIVNITNRFGESITRTNQAYVELATGLHYQSSTGEWLDSKAEIEILTTGGATAGHGQHKAIVPPNLHGGVIELTTPEGKSLRSQILGLAYFDTASGTNVLLAELKDTQGEVHQPNVVIYPDAFTDIKADVRYTYTIDGFEQDIILHEHPADPKEYGLDPTTTRLQVLTEFFNPPQPVKEESELNIAGKNFIDDETLNFGAMQIGRGKAFFLDEPKAAIPVAKQWVNLDGRDFLIEEVPVADVQEELRLLPAAEGASLNSRRARRTASVKRNLPASKIATVGKGRMKLAELKAPRSGLVLDYVTLNTSQTNLTFQSDTTYYLSGNVSLYGTNNTFEGGTVIKYAANVTLGVNTPVTWLGDTFHPILMVSKDDNSVGNTISGSSGSPGTAKYAKTAFSFNAVNANTNLAIRNLRVANAGTAIAINGFGGHVLTHVQLLNCDVGIAATNTDFSLRNALFNNVQTNFVGSSSTGRVEHLTSDVANWLNKDIGSNLFLTNCLLVAVTNLGNYSMLQNIGREASAVGVFTNVGAGNHYLVTGSTNRDAGTTSINAGLLAEFKKMTTVAPVLRSNVTTTTVTVLSPSAQRDIDTPDLGYHYDPIDYLTYNWSFTSTSLTLTNGVIIAYPKAAGINVGSGTSIRSDGSPASMNRFVHYQAVQEQPLVIGSAGIAGAALNSNRGGGSAASGYFRFTEFHGDFGGLMPNYFYTYAGFDYSALTLRDCLFNRGSVNLEARDGTTFAIENNVFETRAYSACGLFNFYDYDGGKSFTLSLRNNLFMGGTCAFYCYDGWSAYCTTLSDNAFDSVQLSSGNPYYPPSTSNEGLIRTSSIGAGSGDVTIPSGSTFTWTAGRLGKYYQFSTNFLNQGSRTANLAGLFHYTTTTNQVKETNSVVDIGFHYVAVDSNGNAIDTDGDGLGDYFEDSNGDGTYAAGDSSNWQVFSTDGSGISDGWQVGYFGQIGISPGADPDGDGLTNMQEYLLGTNPIVNDSTQVGSRINYIYDSGGWLQQITGARSGAVISDNEGNVMQSSQ